MALPMHKDFSALSTYKRLLNFSRAYWHYLIIGLIGSVALSLIDARLTMLIKPVVNYSFDFSSHKHFIQYLPVEVLACLLVRLVAGFLSSYFIGKMSYSVIAKFRLAIFSKLLKMPIAYYDANSSGTMLSTIIYNVDQVSQATSDILLTFLREGVLLVSLIGVMIYENWRMTVLFFLMIPLVLLLLYFFNKIIRSLSTRVQDSMASITSISEEGIKGNEVVRLYDGYEYEFKKMSSALKNNLALQLKIIATNSLSSSLMQLILAIPLLIVISPFIMPYFHLSVGGFALLLGAMLQLPRPARRLSSVNSTLQKGVAAAKSIFDLLDQSSESTGNKTSDQLMKGEIEFKNISFAYASSKSQSLRNISLHIKPGETIGIVGFSGAGKTTLVSMLPRFYDVDSGDIIIDGESLYNLDISYLRKNIALVTQNTTLFNATVRENIAYACPEVDDESLKNAAKMACALDFIEALPLGFDTQIGDNGVLLSGGQRQRIAIARALLKDAPIVIFDEATASLDVHSENQIQQAFDQLRINRTTIVIAHRLSTIEASDRLVVMNHGEIVEVGSHEQLLKEEGYYSSLYRVQIQNMNEVGQ